MVGGGEESTTWAAFEALAAKAVAAPKDQPQAIGILQGGSTNEMENKSLFITRSF